MCQKYFHDIYNIIIGGHHPGGQVGVRFSAPGRLVKFSARGREIDSRVKS